MTPNDPFRSSYHGVPPGTRLNGIYEIEAVIGAGGMGEVYKCREIQTGSPVAVKMLLPDMVDNEAALALFRREAAALHNLPHDAIVRYFLFTVEPVLQRPYLAMEFVNGRSLSNMLDDGPLAFEALIRLMQRVASGLEAAHEHGIIHRDVSPDNIIVPLDDVRRAKIIDFGIARSTQMGDKTIIGSGFAGKDNYASPEQVGLYGNDVTAKSDVYSFGLVLFHALTGQKLDMGGSQFQLVEKRRRMPDLGAVDMRIRPLLERMLQPDPALRPTMGEVANWTPTGSAQTPAAPLYGFDPLRRPESAAPASQDRMPSTARARAASGWGRAWRHCCCWSAVADMPSTSWSGQRPAQRFCRHLRNSLEQWCRRRSSPLDHSPDAKRQRSCPRSRRQRRLRRSMGRGELSASANTWPNILAVTASLSCRLL